MPDDRLAASSDPSDPLDARRQAIAARVLAHAADGDLLEPPGLPDVMLIRADQSYSNGCGVYQPCVALIVQGRKRVMLGDEALVYGTERFLVSSMDLPVSAAVMEASPEKPYLAVGLRLDWRLITALMLEMPAAAGPERRAEPAHDHRVNRAMGTGAVTAPLLDAFDRLLALLDQPADLPVLAPLIRREIHYRLLAGEAGARLRSVVTAGSHSQQITRSIALLSSRFSESLRIDALAREAGMSATSFHQRFKQLTAMSPLQYQKQLRLNEARRLMLAEGLDAATAAFRVGYESPSQFSREYGRRFGAPPGRDVALLRERGLVPANAARQAA